MDTTGHKAEKPELALDPPLVEPPPFIGGQGFPIVGIGASAGGLAAFKAFFSGMPADADPGMAFVLVQHLAPDHKSLLTDLIRRYTRMQVFEVQDGMAVRPNCAYIIPPNRDMAFLSGTLQLMEPSAPHGQRLPIDFFFRSLAQDQRERAICIVLSGTGSDGTLGVRAIKGEGGMVMAQNPASAEYDGMRRSTISTGLVDYEMPPAEMPAQLIAYVAYAFGRPPRPATAPEPKTESSLKKIFIVLRAQTGNDFSQYKLSTINRRIERRMALHQIESLEGYVKYLQQTPTEVEALFRDVLIGVTNFFRDPEAFKVIEEQIIPMIVGGISPGAPVRVWCPGCSTGEEPYSLAILLAERQEEMKLSFKVQVFATDIDSQAIAAARAGLYPASVAADISPQRLARFFTAESGGSGYRIHKSIRDILVFSEQNVIKDPPFSKLDLISCRNLLIYMGGDLQKKVIPLFHYALNPGGCLFLGASETVGEFGDLFVVLDRKLKLYQRKEDLQSERRTALRRFPPPTTAVQDHVPREAGKFAAPGKRLLRELTERSLLSQIAPAAALVNGQGDILYLHGRTGLYLEPAPGETGLNNILKMAREGLRRHLTTALLKAAGVNETVRCPGLRVKTNGGFTMVNLTIRPAATVSGTMSETPLYLVVFEDTPPVASEEAEQAALHAVAGLGGPETDADTRVEALKQELRVKEEYLRTVNEQLETSNGELKSSNEEMQSVNEELQSTNEELETSKEELQSVNEELATVNAELQTKVADLSRTNSDMSNLLAGTGIGTVFVDNQLRILRFTPAATRIINLILSDVGRPVNHILSNLVGYDRLLADVQAVLDSLVPVEVEVQTRAGEWYSMRILPYRTLDNVIEGAAISFVDISLAKKAQEAFRESEEKNRGILESIADAFFSLDDNLAVKYFNPAAERMLSRKASEVIGRRLFDVFPEARGSVFEENCVRCLQKRAALSFEVELAVSPNRNWYDVRIYPEKNGVAIFSQEITARKRAEALLSESESHFRQLAEFLPRPAWICEPDGRCEYVSRKWAEFTGVPAAQQLDFGWLSQVCPDDRDALMAAWKTAAAAGQPFQVEFRIRHHSGEYHRFDMRATALRDAAGRIVKWFGMNIDATRLQTSGSGGTWGPRSAAGELRRHTMTSDDGRLGDSGKLRLRAEEIVRARAAASPGSGQVLSLEEAARTLHELGVHQIELEIQNEELLRAQVELDAARERYFDLYDLAPVGYLTLSEHGLILEANLTAANLLGMARAGLVRQPLSRFVFPEDQDVHYRHFKQLLDAGGPRAWELRLLRRDSAPFWARVEATAVKDAAASGFRVIVSDIAEQKLREQGTAELESQNRQLIQRQAESLARQRLESVGTLASGIAHDFNNLLGMVLAQADLALAEIASGASPEEELCKIRAVAIRGSEIGRQLMIYAGAESEALALIDVSQTIQEMLELLKVSVSKHAVLETDLGRNLPAITATPAPLRRLVMNLVTNASEAIGGEDGVIRVTTSKATVFRGSAAATSERLAEGDYLQVQVSDTGRGMTPETQARMFDPLFTTKSAGHGLGLAVVREIVYGLRGAIRVASTPGKGSTFDVFLPCAGHEGQTDRSILSPAREEAVPFRAGTILLVEDEASLRQPVSKLIRKAGYSVIEAGDGSAALDLIREPRNHIDVLVLDITLPGASSREVFQEAGRLRPDMKVIVASGYSADMAAATLDGRVERFVRKPYQTADLMALIGHARDEQST